MRFKNAPAQLKASEPGDTAAEAAAAAGVFEAIISVFDNEDADADVVRAGAFKDTIAEWKAGGDPIPVWWSHRMDDPTMNVGAVLDIEEMEPGDKRIPEWADPWVKEHGGLWMRGQIDMDADASDKAVATRRLLKTRRVTQFSYAYDVLDGSVRTHSKESGGSFYEIRKVRLYEVSPTPIGANAMTELVGAKHGAKAGRVLSSRNEAIIREAIDRLSDVLASLDGSDSATEDDETATDEEPTAGEAGAAKSQEPARLTAASVRSLSDVHTLACEVAA